jgi:hypothetical protein
MMKTRRNNFKFFSYIKNRINFSTDRLIQQIKEDTKGLNERKEKREFGIHTQTIYPDPNFNIEHNMKTLQMEPKVDELKNILLLLQRMCDNCHRGFQDYLRCQDIERPSSLQDETEDAQ